MDAFKIVADSLKWYDTRSIISNARVLIHSYSLMEEDFSIIVSKSVVWKFMTLVIIPCAIRQVEDLTSNKFFSNHDVTVADETLFLKTKYEDTPLLSIRLVISIYLVVDGKPNISFLLFSHSLRNIDT